MNVWLHENGVFWGGGGCEDKFCNETGLKLPIEDLIEDKTDAF